MYPQFKKVYQSVSSWGKKETILSLSSEEIQCRELLIHEMKELRSQTKFGWVMQRWASRKSSPFYCVDFLTGRRSKGVSPGFLLEPRSWSIWGEEGLSDRPGLAGNIHDKNTVPAGRIAGNRNVLSPLHLLWMFPTPKSTRKLENRDLVQVDEHNAGKSRERERHDESREVEVKHRKMSSICGSPARC